MIVFFTQRLIDGSGDVAHTAKIARHLEKILEEKHGVKIDICLVTPNPPQEDSYRRNQYTWVTNFYRNMYPDSNVKIITIEEYRHIDQNLIDCHIDAGTLIPEKMPHAFSDEDVQLINLLRDGCSKPYISFPEYSSQELLRGNKIVRSGFKQGEHGVIPNQKILDATKDPKLLDMEKEQASHHLPLKLKNTLMSDFSSFAEYHRSHGLNYAYFHELISTPHDEYTTEFFLEKQIAFLDASKKNQDIICIGGQNEIKHLALEHKISALKQSGFNEIVFIDVDSGQEETLFKDEESIEKKTYRMLCIKSVPYTCMESLPLISDDLVGVTGDNSLVEAMSAGKIFMYEYTNHKYAFMAGYLSKVQELSSDFRVYELAKYLVFQGDLTPEKLAEYAQNPEIVNTLKSINRILISESKYLDEVEKAVVSNIKQLQPPPPEKESCFKLLKRKYHNLVQSFYKNEAPSLSNDNKGPR